MSVLIRRSSRLMMKDKGAPVPPTSILKLSGSGGPHTDPKIAAKVAIQSMDFSFYWREKDYGDAVMEEWYFTIRAKTNLSYQNPHQDLTFSFWRNFVYFSPTHILFGYYNSRTYIYKKGDAAIFRDQIFSSVKEYTLAIPFDEVVARMQASMENLNKTVENSAVYSFPLGDIKGVQWFDQHNPPVAHISFL